MSNGMIFEGSQFNGPMVASPDFESLATQHGPAVLRAIDIAMISEGPRSALIDPRLDVNMRELRQITDWLGGTMSDTPLSYDEANAGFMAFHVSYRIGSLLLQSSPGIELDSFAGLHKMLPASRLVGRSREYMHPRIALGAMTDRLLGRLHVMPSFEATARSIAGLTLRYIETSEKQAHERALVAVFTEALESDENTDAYMKAWKKTIRPNAELVETFHAELQDDSATLERLSRWHAAAFPSEDE